MRSYISFLKDRSLHSRRPRSGAPRARLLIILGAISLASFMAIPVAAQEGRPPGGVTVADQLAGQNPVDNSLINMLKAADAGAEASNLEGQEGQEGQQGGDGNGAGSGGAGGDGGDDDDCVRITAEPGCEKKPSDPPVVNADPLENVAAENNPAVQNGQQQPPAGDATTTPTEGATTPPADGSTTPPADGSGTEVVKGAQTGSGTDCEHNAAECDQPKDEGAEDPPVDKPLGMEDIATGTGSAACGPGMPRGPCTLTSDLVAARDAAHEAAGLNSSEPSADPASQYQQKLTDAKKVCAESPDRDACPLRFDDGDYDGFWYADDKNDDCNAFDSDGDCKPNWEDSDGDTQEDGFEAYFGSNPTDPDDFLVGECDDIYDTANCKLTASSKLPEDEGAVAGTDPDTAPAEGTTTAPVVGVTTGADGTRPAQNGPAVQTAPVGVQMEQPAGTDNGVQLFEYTVGDQKWDVELRPDGQYYIDLDQGAGKNFQCFNPETGDLCGAQTAGGGASGGGGGGRIVTYPTGGGGGGGGGRPAVRRPAGNAGGAAGGGYRYPSTGAGGGYGLGDYGLDPSAYDLGGAYDDYLGLDDEYLDKYLDDLLGGYGTGTGVKPGTRTGTKAGGLPTAGYGSSGYGLPGYSGYGSTPSSSSSRGTLPFTGSDTLPLLLAGLGLLSAGGAIIVFTRGRRASAS